MGSKSFQPACVDYPNMMSVVRHVRHHPPGLHYPGARDALLGRLESTKART
jgi:hypothetical protein